MADALALWLSNFLEERTISRDEYRQTLSRLDILENEVAYLKAEARELRREMHERMDQMYAQMVVLTR